jgi:hypothetical protein
MMSLSIVTRSDSSLERVHFFSRQLITAEDMTAEQEYFRQKLRRHNRYLHGWGVVCGFQVAAAPTSTHPWRVQICPGYLITPQGDEIELAKAVYFDLGVVGAEVFDPCASAVVRTHAEPDSKVHLAICYSECATHPVRIHPAGCACDEAGCEYTRTRDHFELTVLHDVPDSHVTAQLADDDWYDTCVNWPENADDKPVPPCVACPDDCWVVLASFMLPGDRKTRLDFGEESSEARSYEWRRVLYSTTALRQMIR